jgi:DNA-binding GntR family transcriptional regulator
MFDIVHPSIELPETKVLTRKLESGRMVLDVLIGLEVPIGYARTRVMPCLVTPREQLGKALQLPRATAALELEEVIYAADGNPVAYSRDLFAPEAHDVHVMRSLDPVTPAPIGGGTSGRRPRASRTTTARR